MTTAAQLGMKEPVGSDLISTGDDDIAHNARRTAVAYDALLLHATSEAGAAYTDAVNTAAIDATGKANAAKTDAISAAATDATGKANAAKTDAIADATGKYGGLPQRVEDVEQKNLDQDEVLERTPRKYEAIRAAVVGGTIDAVGRLTWLSYDPYGAPTEYARKNIRLELIDKIRLRGGFLDDSHRATELVFDSAGKVPKTITDAWLARSGVSKRNSLFLAGGFLDRDNRSTELVFDHYGRVPGEILADWAARETPSISSTRTVWGHSLAAGVAGGATPWSPMLADLLGVPVDNYGVGGASSAHVGARQGGKPALVTVDGGMIPTSGPIGMFMDTDYMFGGVSGAQPVTIRGISGVMQKDADVGEGADCTFTRYDSGSAVAVPDGSPLRTDYGAASRGNVTYIWAARNDFFKAGNSPARTVENISRMVEYLTSVHVKVLILEEPPAVSETIGTANRAEVDAYNDAIRQAFPHMWVPVMTWLRTEAAALAAGITFTTQDLTDISSGVTPATFRVDTLHLSTAGNTAIAHRLLTEEINRGWI